MNYTILFFVLLGLFLFFSLFFTVKQQTAVSIERFGKFQSIRHSGLQLKIPVIDKVAARISLKIQQLDVIVETKTLDDVFVKIKVSVQFVVIKDKVYDAIYKLEYPHDQITSYVFDVVRAEVPKMKLDDVFVKKDDIAIAVKREVQESMETYGYDIIKTLVTDIDPDAQVKAAMNRINAAEREKVAAQYEGDAQRILIVEKAKAEAESKRLIVVTQHYDTLQAVGQDTKSNLILLPNSPQAGAEMLTNMIASFAASNQVGGMIKKKE